LASPDVRFGVGTTGRYGEVYVYVFILPVKSESGSVVVVLTIIDRVSITPGNLLEFKNPAGNPGNLLEFVWSSWKFLCKMSMIDLIGFQS